MARHLRRYDVHGHLVTTSDDDLHHALWSAMDYYQPHLYATNMVLGLQSLELSPAQIDRPVFYGEMGDDNMVGLSSEQRATGFVHPILAWAGLFGRATQPAQLWYVETLRQNDRWSEIESLGAFVRASGILRRPLPHIEHPLVIGGETASLTLTPGHYWHRGPDPVLEIPTDGTQPPELMHVLRILNDPADHGGFPSRMTLRLSSPAASNATLHLARMGNRGGSLRVTVDETVVIDERWPAATSARPTPTRLSFPFRLGFGDHRIVIENPAGPDWIDLSGLDLGLPVPALTAVARRDPERIVLWVHHRDNLLSPEPDEALTPSSATVQLAEVPAGEWTLTWWDTSAGRSGGSTTIQHPGGALMVETPEITRHQAAWLERLK